MSPRLGKSRFTQLFGIRWGYVAAVMIFMGLLLKASTHAAGGNALDRIDFGNANSEGAHSFMQGAALSDIAPKGVGPFGQTYRLPVGTGNSYAQGTQVLYFTISCDPAKQNYLTVKYWGSDRNVMMFMLDERGNNPVPYGDVGFDTFVGHGYPPTFPNRFFYYTVLIPQNLTQGKTSVKLGLLTTESFNRYTKGEKHQYMAKGQSGRPVYSAISHTDPCYVPDSSEVVGTAPAVTGLPSSYPAITASQANGYLQTARANVVGPGGSVDWWIAQQIWTNNYAALTSTNYVPPPPETIGLSLRRDVRTFGGTSADDWRNCVAYTGCALNPGYTAVPGPMISTYAGAYVLPPFTNASGNVVAGLDRYHNPDLLLRTVKAIDACTYLVDADGGFLQQANQQELTPGDRWTGICSPGNPRKSGAAIGTTARLGTVHGGGDLQGAGTYNIGWSICKLLADTNGPNSGRDALMAYLNPSNTNNAFDADFTGTKMARVYAWERMLYKCVNFYAQATGGTTSQNDFQVLGMYANWVALQRLQALYPNTNYVVKWDAANSTYNGGKDCNLGTNSPLQAAEMVCGIIPTTLRGSYVSGYTNYAITEKGLGEGGGSLACGFDGGAYGKYIASFPLMISEIASWDTGNVDSALLSRFANRVNAAHDAYEQLITAKYDIGNPVTSGLASNSTFTLAPESFITWRSFFNLNASAGGYDVNLNWAAAGTNGVVNNAYMRRAAYLMINKYNGCVPGDIMGAVDYERALRGLINVDPATLTALPGEPGQPDSVWFDPQAQSFVVRNKGETIFMNANWRRGPGNLSQWARIHYTTPTIERGATIVMPYDNTTVQPDGNFSSTNLFDKYVVRYGDYLFAVNSSSNSTQTVKLPPGYGQAKDLISSNYYNLGSTMTVGPSNAAVLWLTASNAPTGFNPPTVTMPAAASSTNVTNTSVNLSVAAVNNGVGTAIYTWSLTGYPPAPVTFSANSNSTASSVTARFTAAGTYSFNVTISNGTGATNSIVQVNVEPTVTSVEITPSNSVVVAGESLNLGALIKDQFGNVMPSSQATSWYKLSGIGSLTPLGTYTAPLNTGGQAVVGFSVGGNTYSKIITVQQSVGIFTYSSFVGGYPLGGAIYNSGTNGGTYTVTDGYGGVWIDHIWNWNDDFQYAWRIIRGDFVFTARLKSFTASGPDGLAGLMIRRSLDASGGDAAYTYLYSKQSSGVSQGVFLDGRKDWNSYNIASTNSSDTTYPIWMRVTRTGDTYYAEYASDANGVPGSWSLLGVPITDYPVSMSAYVGLAVAGGHDRSYTAANAAKAQFDHVTISRNTQNGIFPYSQGINTSPGSYDENLASNSVTMDSTSSGDVAKGADGVNYAYRNIIGNMTLTARISSVSADNPGAKVGLMVRESSNPGSKEVSVLLEPSGKLHGIISRSVTGGGTTDQIYSGTYPAPYWIRLMRNGSQFATYGSTNGTNWSQLGTATIGMSNTVTAGLFVTSVDGSQTTVSFDNVAIVGNTNTAPVFVQQPSGTLTNKTVNLSALATDDGGPGNLTYTWGVVGQAPGNIIFSSNNGTSSATNITATVDAPGIYYVQATVSDIYGETAASGIYALGGQNINFPQIPDQPYVSNGTIAINATADPSGLPVSFWSPSTNVYLSSNTLTILGAGTVSVVAEQWGNTNWPIAQAITNTFVINKASNVIAPFASIPASYYFKGQTLQIPLPVASSGLPVALSVKSGPATIASNLLSVSAPGTVVLAADQAGNANYLPSTQVTTNIAILSQAPVNVTPFAWNKSVTLTWSPVAGASGYVVRKSGTSNGPFTTIYSGTNAYFVDQGGGGVNALANNSDYYYTVATLSSNGESEDISLLATPRTQIIWTGTNSGTWDTVTRNWTTNGNPTAFANGSRVQFDDTALTSNLTISGRLTPVGVYMSNTAISYSLAGANGLSGAARFVKRGTGALQVKDAQPFTGGLAVLDPCQILLSTNGTLGNGTVSFYANTVITNSGATGGTNVLASGFESVPGKNVLFNAASSLLLNGNLTGDGTLTFAPSTFSYPYSLSGTNGGFRGWINLDGVASVLLSSTNSGDSNAIWTLLSEGNRLGANVSGGSFAIGELQGTAGVIFNNQTNSANTATFILGNNNGGSPVFGGRLVDNGNALVGVTKVGSNTQTLAGGNTYSGPTLVSQGRLNVSPASSGRGNYAVSPGAILGVANNFDGSSLGVSTLTLGGGTLVLSDIAHPSTPRIQAGSLVFVGTNTIVIPDGNQLFTNTIYPLLSGTVGGDPSSLGISLPNGWSGRLITNSRSIQLKVTGYSVPNAPAVPTNLAATPLESKVLLRWDPVSGASSYNILRKINGDSAFRRVASGLTAPSYEDAGLASSTTYVYLVTAVNQSGSSYYSDSLSVKTGDIPPPPAAITITPASGQNSLGWQAAPKAISYTVRRSTNGTTGYQIIASNLTETNYTDAGLTNGILYYYTISSYGTGGEGIASAVTGGIPTAPSSTYVWTNITSSAASWNSASNWSGGSGFPNASGASAFLNPVLSSPQLVTIGQTVTSSALSIGSGCVTGVGSLTLAASGSGTLILANPGGQTLITQVSSRVTNAISVPIVLSNNLTILNGSTSAPLVISASITERTPLKSLTIAGSGDIQLSGSNAYTGGTYITSGRVILGASQILAGSGPLGGVTNPLSIASGGVLDLNGNTMGVTRFSGSGVVTNSSIGTGTLVLGGGLDGVTLQGNLAVVCLANQGSLSSTAVQNTHTGEVVFKDQGATSLQAPSLTLANQSFFGSGTISFAGSGGFTVPSSGSTRWINGILTNPVSVTSSNNSVDISSANGDGLVEMSGPWTGDGSLAFIPTLSPSFRFSGDLSGFTGKLILNVANAALANPKGYAGMAICLRGGILGYTGSGTNTIALGSLESSNAAAVFGNQSGTGTVTFRIGSRNSAATFAGSITDTGDSITAITKTGSGTWTLSGSNSYSGGTTVESGGLTLTGSGSLGASTGSLYITGGSLDLGGNAVSPSTLFLTRGSVVNGSVSAGSYVLSDGLISAALSGGGAISKIGSGTVTLSGASSSHTGDLVVNAGTLCVAGQMDGANGRTVSAGPNATLAGYGTLSGNITIASGGILAPGSNGSGTLTLRGSLSLSAGSFLNIQLTNPATSGGVVVAGSYTPPSGGFVGVNLSGANNGSYNLLAGPGGIDVSQFQIVSSPYNKLCVLTNQGGNLQVAVSDLTIPAPTSNLVVSSGNNALQLSWAAALGSTGYVVKRSTNQAGPYSSIATIQTNAFTDTNVTQGTSYYYRVDATNYLGSSSMTNSVTESARSSQTISNFAPISDQYASNNARVTVAIPAASSGLPVSVAVKSGPATVISSFLSNVVLNLTGVGTVTLGAQQVGNAAWSAAPEVTTTFNVNKSPQMISFGALSNQVYGGAPFKLSSNNATATSGLPVSFSTTNTQLLRITSNTATILGAGTVSVVASQQGNSNYLAATPVTNAFVINPASNVISPLATIAPQVYSVGARVSVTVPKASSGLVVSLSIAPDSTNIASVSGNVVTLLGAGTVTVVASQSGNTNYAPATPVSTRFAVAKGNQSISFGLLSGVQVGSTPFRLPATASSGLPLTYTVSSNNIVSVDASGWVTALNPGTVTITASQSGNANWNAASSVSRSLVVSGAASVTGSPLVSSAGIATNSSVPTIPSRVTTFPLVRPSVQGTVTSWGNNTYGETNVPAGLTNVVQLSTRGLHNLALKKDGSVVAWGWNSYGQATVPGAAMGAVQVAAGVSFSSALKADGSVVVWGDNSFGQAVIPANATNIVQIAAGSHHLLGLRSDGSVVGWGWNQFGQTTVPLNVTNVVQVAAGYFHSAALRADGRVVAWGDNTYNELNIPTSATNVVRLVTGLNHTVALKADGTVAAWGWNNAGQTNVPANLSGISQIVSGGNTVFAVKTNGVVTMWGDKSYQRMAIPKGYTGVKQFFLGLYHALGLK
jgi:autotransporter-associated beta strand protein